MKTTSCTTAKDNRMNHTYLKFLNLIRDASVTVVPRVFKPTKREM